MRKTILITIFAILSVGFFAIPGFALSSLAEDFLKACTALDAPFPPKGWDRGELRSASIEVLDAIERGSYEKWPLDFCLKALGSTHFPQDLPRILAYEDEMPDTVIRSLKGFPSAKAIDFLIGYLDDKEATMRELAIYSLADIDFTSLADSKKWHDKVIGEVRKMKSQEKVEWLKKDIDIVLDKLEKSKTNDSK